MSTVQVEQQLQKWRLRRPDVVGGSRWLSPPFAGAKNNTAQTAREHDSHGAVRSHMKLMIQGGTKRVMSGGFHKGCKITTSVQRMMRSFFRASVFLV